MVRGRRPPPEDRSQDLSVGWVQAPGTWTLSSPRRVDSGTGWRQCDGVELGIGTQRYPAPVGDLLPPDETTMATVGSLGGVEHPGVGLEPTGNHRGHDMVTKGLESPGDPVGLTHVIAPVRAGGCIHSWSMAPDEASVQGDSRGANLLPMFERFTDRARRVLVLGQEEARLLNHDFFGTEHILLGLIHEGDGVAAKALEQMGIELDDVRAKVEETIGQSALSGGPAVGSPPFTPRAKKVLDLAMREALQLGHNYIGTEHILLGLMHEGEGVGAQVLTSLGADPARVRQEVLNILSNHQSSGEPGYPPWDGDHRRRGRIVSCSFCLRQSPETGRLISGQGAFICEHCVRQWSEQLNEDEDADDE
jgi:Clp amino terminal domain, pathogenicity island component/ClpX C4-type zinc finger